MESESSKQSDHQSSIVPGERIEQTILLIREEKVILDVDLAVLYGDDKEAGTSKSGETAIVFRGTFRLAFTNNG